MDTHKPEYLDMKAAVKSSKYPIPTVEKLTHKLQGSDRLSFLDMDHAFHQFELGKEIKKIFLLYAPYDLYNFNTLVMRTA